MNFYWVSQSFHVDEVAWGLRQQEKGTWVMRRLGEVVGVDGAQALGWRDHSKSHLDRLLGVPLGGSLTPESLFPYLKNGV